MRNASSLRGAGPQRPDHEVAGRHENAGDLGPGEEDPLHAPRGLQRVIRGVHDHGVRKPPFPAGLADSAHPVMHVRQAVGAREHGKAGVPEVCEVLRPHAGAQGVVHVDVVRGDP